MNIRQNIFQKWQKWRKSMHKDSDKRIFPDSICATCIHYEDGVCKLNDVDVHDQDRCDKYMFDALCVDCGAELADGTLINGLLSCKCKCCGTISVGPTGYDFKD
jgi:hypothetical protein